MKKTYWILTTLAFSLCFSACKKYEEGPLLSLRSKKQRVANTWMVEEAHDGDENVTNRYDRYVLDLDKDGDARLEASYSWGNFSLEIETNGTWDFSDDKDKLLLNFENDDADVTYQILRLKENELWLREEGEDLELRLETQ